MTFLNPLGLIGLLALPIIVILHLLRERQRPHVVSDLGLWAFLDTQARGARTRRVPITRLLLLDLLVAALISLAWAQPSLAIELPGEQAKHLVIVLDVSASMLAEEAGVGGASRFARAQIQAAGLADEAGPDDRVTVITFGRQARLVYDSRTSGEQNSAQVALLALDAGESGASGAALQEALAVGQAALDPDLLAKFYVFTDGAYADNGLATYLTEFFPYTLIWRWFGGTMNNQAIVALSVSEVGSDMLHIFVRVVNTHNQEISKTITLSINKQNANQASLVLPPDSAVAYVWQIQRGPRADPAYVEVVLDGKDALSADDRAAAGLQPGGEARVAVVAEDAAVLQQAVDAVPGATAQMFLPEAYAKESAAGGVEGYDLTIFRGTLPAEWPESDILVVEPPEKSGVSGAELRAIGKSMIPVGAPLLTPDLSRLTEEIDFSSVRWGRAARLGAPPQGFSTLLQAGDVPLLMSGSLLNRAGGASSAWLLLADLGTGNFTKQPAFPIMIANLVEQARGAPLPPSIKTGQPLPLPPAGNYAAIRVTNPNGESTNWQGTWPGVFRETERAGIYQVELIDAAGKRAVFAAGANAGDENESDLRPRAWTENALTKTTQSPELIDGDSPSVDLWPWLLAAAALLLLAEARLAWRS